MSKFDMLIEGVPMAIGRDAVLSRTVRSEESPPSASMHLSLDGVEYVWILQPTDMPAPSEYGLRERQPARVRRGSDDDGRSQGGAKTK